MSVSENDLHIFFDHLAQHGSGGGSLSVLNQRRTTLKQVTDTDVFQALEHVRVASLETLWDENLSSKDQIFEILMTRLECLSPYRLGVCRLMADAARYDWRALEWMLIWGRYAYENMGRLAARVSGQHAGILGIPQNAWMLADTRLLLLWGQSVEDTSQTLLAAVDQNVDLLCACLKI